MPDTDRLYALASTYNHPWLSDEAGPGLLINDAVVAMRWYLTHEREENLAVAGHVSDDDGATWQPLPARELLADAERALVRAAQAPGEEARHTAALLQDALAAEAADWLDHRLRHVQPDDPAQDRPNTPAPASWRRGGQIWALALGTVPHAEVLAHLTAQHAVPQPEGTARLRAAALETLGALALAEEPEYGDPAELLAALAHMNRLTFGFEIGQLRGLAQDAEQSLMNHLITRLPETAPVAEAHPDPQHPANQAARTYLRRLSLIGPDGEERLLADAAHDLTKALAAAEDAEQHPAPLPDVDANVEADAIPGYPKHLPGELQAAAQWRLLSPAARRSAEQTMEQLVRAATALTQSTAAADPNRPPSAQEDQALLAHSRLHGELDELTARHALLMHASVLADAEAAAVPATHEAIVAAAQASEAQAQPTTAAEVTAAQEAFMAQVNAAEGRIAETLDAQRQLTRDALHRIFPQAVTNSALHTVRTQLVEHSGLGLDAYNQAYRAMRETGHALESLVARYRSKTLEFGRPTVTTEQLEQARTAAQNADSHFADLQHSRPLTLRAVKALDGAAHLDPSPSDSVATRAARLAARLRESALPATPTAPRTDAAARQAQQHNLQTPQAGPGISPS
ncbi:hypothetical protein [Streptomyces botrytidirepellens]|uniref:Uncharacterized protein n=1 Tax=Streptomyces botrytidirepellens TaxID=2486417 RepID=A0A3M8SIQ7_9ACTN|nr:hypothetical protein [Streptomyces botrytidirepellens]RNF81161.1 hypothetical protein EEJ42_47110 [Streptomyces botrytidirepellens]